MAAVLGSLLNKDAVLCKAGPAINNGTAVMQGQNIGDITTYTCSRDYRMNGSSAFGMSANSTCVMSANNMTAFWSEVPYCTETVRLLVSMDVEAWVYSVAILPDRQILAILDNGFEKLLRLYDSAMSSLQLPFDASDVKQAVDIAVKHTGNTAVADLSNHSIHTFTQLNNSVWMKDRFQVELPPIHLTFTPEGDILLDSGQGSDRILKYTVAGEKLWDKNISRQPYWLTTNRMGQIIASSWNHFNVYTKDLDWLFSLTLKADVVNIYSVKGVVTDTEDNILVVNEDQEAVLLFSPEGHYIRRLLTVRGDINVIALHEDMLVVGSWLSTTIYVYLYA